MNKPKINEIIKSTRKAKGLTQQELANEAGVSLRTVQRIEKGTEEISGFSLKQISKVLDIPLNQIMMQNVNQISIDTNQTGSIRILYLSSLTFILNPILGVIVPAIIGFTKKNKNDEYKKQLKKVLTIQIVGLIYLGILQYIIVFHSSYVISSLKNINIFNIGSTELILIALSYTYWIGVICIVLYNIIKLKSQSEK